MTIQWNARGVLPGWRLGPWG